MKIRKEKMIELRKQGMTYEEIAKEVGTSRQRVYQIIGGNYRRHRKFKEDEIVYAGLRNWMNDHDMG
jgi:transcriptional regulator